MQGTQASPPPSTIISPQSRSLAAQLRAVWHFRYLISSFAIRDYKVRFAQTALGYLWALLQPLATLAVLYLVFAKMMKVETDATDYFPFALSGLMYWSYFSLVSTQSAGGLIQSQPLLRKIYFPRLCIPFSKALVGLVEFGVAWLLLALYLLWQGEFTLRGLFLSIPLLLLTTLAAQGVGLWLSAWSIRYRDMQQILPFALQFLFFVTPVAYSARPLGALLPEGYRHWWYLNPMMGIIEASRWSWFGTALSGHVWLSIAVALLLFGSGLWMFNRLEKQMADWI